MYQTLKKIFLFIHLVPKSWAKSRFPSFIANLEFRITMPLRNPKHRANKNRSESTFLISTLVTRKYLVNGDNSPTKWEYLASASSGATIIIARNYRARDKSDAGTLQHCPDRHGSRDR